MNPHSNYPRSQFGRSIEDTRSLVKKLNVMAGLLLVLLFILYASEQLFPPNYEFDQVTLLLGLSLLFVFVAFLVVLALQAIWGSWMTRAVSEINGDSLKISPRWIGFFCWWPIFGSFVLAYVVEYAITSCNRPRQPSMKWYTVLSKSTLGSIVVYSAALSACVDIVSFLPNIDKRLPLLTSLSPVSGLVTTVCLFLGMRNSTKKLLLLAEKMELENSQQSIRNYEN